MNVFEDCHKINDLLIVGNEHEARNELIRLLATLRENGIEYSPLINHLIREVGLFPYLEPTTASWQERYIYEVFKADVGDPEAITLHREQSRLLNSLLAGKSIAVSAPTSFGKSFVIDSFIAIKKPSNVVILVPTIALADETRRRLERKFGRTYKIITAADQSLTEKNILIFPQERAISYAGVLKHIDILIVDEFYKASSDFDNERSPALIRAIIKLSKIAAQRYFLAPNISELKENPFTQGMEILHLDFNTVFLERTELFSQIGKDEQKKSEILIDILGQNPSKTLIYAGTYTNIDKLSTLLMTRLETLNRNLLNSFRSWLAKNYDPNWALANLVVKGVGIHNGRLHRPLSQIQIKLFDDKEREGIDRIISTSSIIEGVNTSAEIVVLWSNRNGKAKINDFTYKNIIGRGGRMFRHFIGKIFILEEPPADTKTRLVLEIPDKLLGILDENSFDFDLTPGQKETLEQYKAEMQELVGPENFAYFRESEVFQSSDFDVILKIVRDIKHNTSSWNGLGYLNSNDASDWDYFLKKLIRLRPGAWDIEYDRYVKFVKILSKNWQLSIPNLLQELNELDIEIDKFFQLERNTTFKLASLLSDVHTIYNRLNLANPVDLTPAISKLSHAFLPVVVYQLEEYGMPRMISRKIHAAKVLNLENPAISVHEAIETFRKIGCEQLVKSVGEFDEFDEYILRYFYEGIEYERWSLTTPSF